jgi:transposase
METLAQLIYCNREPRKLKRALAVQMSQQGHSYPEIRDVLQVSAGFVTPSAVNATRQQDWSD